LTSSFPGAPVATHILVRPCVEVKAIKGDPLSADGDLSEGGPHGQIEDTAIHAEIRGGVAKANEAWRDHDAGLALGGNWTRGRVVIRMSRKTKSLRLNALVMINRYRVQILIPCRDIDVKLGPRGR